MIVDVTFVMTLGKVLSGLASLLALGAVISVWRRASFPSVAYGGVSLSNRRIRWVWFLVILGGFTLGVGEDPVVTRTHSPDNPNSPSPEQMTRAVTVSIPLPFYWYERVRYYEAGALVGESVAEGFLIPWQLLSALFAYLVLVLLWNPDSPWALRILRGRRRENRPSD